MQQGHREQLTASCWSPWAAGGSSLVLSALWGRVTGACTPFLLLGICEHETRATAVGILLKWWHEHGRGICCHFMGNSKLPPTAIVRPLVSESSMVHASFVLVHLIGIKVYSWKVQQLFKFHRRIVGFPELRKQTNKQQNWLVSLCSFCPIQSQIMYLKALYCHLQYFYTQLRKSLAL